MSVVWRVVTPPEAWPVTLAQAKAHLRVDISDDDALITALIAAASQYVEEAAGVSTTPRVMEALLTRWPSPGLLRLPRPPVASVAWVRYTDASGAQVDMPPTEYAVRAEGIWARKWPSAALSDAVEHPITIRYTAGSADTPAPVRHAILLLIGHWYEHREAAVSGHMSRDIALGVDALIAPYRRWGM